MDVFNPFLCHLPQRYTSKVVSSSARVLYSAFRRSRAWKQGNIVGLGLNSGRRCQIETSLSRFRLKSRMTTRALNGQAPAPQENNDFLPVRSDPEDSAVLSLLVSSSSDLIVKVKSSESSHRLLQGEFVEKSNRLLYRQKFVIRSYEVGADKTTDITTIISFFQEVSLCHVQLMGISGDGFGATKAMNSLGLIWVVSKMHVEVEQLPKWSDVIVIDSWIARSGKNGMRRDWIVRRNDTNEVLIRATSNWCMMDSKTRRVCRMPDTASAELNPFFMDEQYAFRQKNILSTRIAKLDNSTIEHVSSPIKSCRDDLDVNQHVSNLKYVSWALQSVPDDHKETHNLASITLEYRRELSKSKNVVESLTSSKTITEEVPPSVASVPSEGFWNLFTRSALSPRCEYTHLLRTRDAQELEIVRARTTWLPKSRNTAPFVVARN